MDSPEGAFYSSTSGATLTDVTSGLSAPLATHVFGASLDWVLLRVTGSGAIIQDVAMDFTRCFSVQSTGEERDVTLR